MCSPDISLQAPVFDSCISEYAFHCLWVSWPAMAGSDGKDDFNHTPSLRNEIWTFAECLPAWEYSFVVSVCSERAKGTGPPLSLLCPPSPESLDLLLLSPPGRWHLPQGGLPTPKFRGNTMPLTSPHPHPHLHAAFAATEKRKRSG